MRSQNEFFGFNQFTIFWTGVVEDIHDPIKAGRVKVRCHGIHNEDREKLKPKDLLWANVLMPVQSASNSGVGSSPTALLPGTWCCGIFLDGADCQMPLVIGTLPGLHKFGNVSPGTARPGQGGYGQPGSGGGSGLPPGVDPGLGGLPWSTGGGPGGGGGTTGGSTSGGGGTVAPSGSFGSPPKGHDGASSQGISWAANWGRNSGELSGNLVTITSQSGATFKVDSTVAGNFRGFINELEGRGYSIDPSISAGYVNKPLEHGVGNAIDINWGRNGDINAFGHSDTDLPDDVGAMASRHGLTWGGHWDRQDMMHFEYNPAHGVPTRGYEQADMAAGTVPAEPSPTETPTPSYTEDPPPEHFPGELPDNPAQYPSNDPIVTSDPSLYQPSPDGFQYTQPNDIGFNDPNSQYPALWSPDHSTHPWARGVPDTEMPIDGQPYMPKPDSITTTDILKDAQRRYGIPEADGGYFEEPVSKNVGQYPQNMLGVYKGGIKMEFDSTPGAERYHLYHPSGSYTELDAKGNMVSKAHGDRNEIDMGNRKVGGKGSYSVSAEGSLKMLSGADTFMETRGNFSGNFNHDVRLDIRGGGVVNATDHLRLSAKQVTIEGTGGDVNIKSSAEVNLESAADMNLQSGGELALESKGNMLQKATGDLAQQASGEIRQQSGTDYAIKAGGKLAMQGESAIHVKSQGDIKLDGATIHSKSSQHRFSGIITSPNAPLTPIPVGPGPAAAGADDAAAASEKMNAKADKNKQAARDGGSGGSSVAGHSKTDLNQEVKEAPVKHDRPVVSPKPTPSYKDQRFMATNPEKKSMFDNYMSRYQSRPSGPRGVNSPAYQGAVRSPARK
jgi:hypothetical protein